MKKAYELSRRHDQGGFTMIELLITIIVVATLASIAVPSMRSYVLNSRITSVAQELLRTLQTARSEAAKRQKNVVICASSNPLGVAPVCQPTPSSTASGWIMFEDTDGSWTRDILPVVEPLVEVHTFDSANVKLLSDGENRISYSPTGFAAVGNGASPQIRSTAIVVCDSRGNVDSSGGTTGQSVARGIYIDPTGRPRVSKYANSSADNHDISELLADVLADSGATC